MKFLADMGIAQKPENVNRRLEIVLREAANDLKSGAIISVDEFRYRIRRLPIVL